MPGKNKKGFFKQLDMKLNDTNDRTYIKECEDIGKELTINGHSARDGNKDNDQNEQ